MISKVLILFFSLSSYVLAELPKITSIAGINTQASDPATIIVDIFFSAMFWIGTFLMIFSVGSIMFTIVGKYRESQDKNDFSIFMSALFSGLLTALLGIACGALLIYWSE